MLESPPMRLVVLMTLLLLTACENSPDRHTPKRERPTGEENEALFRKIGLEFETGKGDEINALLADACKNAKLAASVARLMMFHMKDAAQRQRDKQANRFQFRDLESNFRYTRARSALGTMGPVAVPTVIDELMKNRFTDNRQIGVQILASMSKDVLPMLKQAVIDSKPTFRHNYVAAVAGMKPSPERELMLLDWSKNDDYLVRSGAFVGLQRAGDRHLALLRDAVARDPDTFVQKQVVKVLGGFTDRVTAATVIAYYARCEKRGDRMGASEAERTLVKISKKPPTRRGRLIHYGLSYWRKWVLTLPVDGGNR